MSARRHLGLLLAPVLAGSVLAAAAPAPPAAAAPGEEFRAVDLVGHEALLTLTGDGLHHQTPSLDGLIVADQGYAGAEPPVAQREQVWGTYGSGERIAKATSLLDTATDAALIYTTRSGPTDVPSLAAVVDDGGNRRVVVTRQQAAGFDEVRHGAPVEASAEQVGVSQVVGTREPVVLVGTGGQLVTYRLQYDGNDLPQGDLQRNAALSTADGDFGRVLDIFARPDTRANTTSVGADRHRELVRVLHQNTGDVTAGRVRSTLLRVVANPSLPGLLLAAEVESQVWSVPGDVVSGSVLNDDGDPTTDETVVVTVEQAGTTTNLLLEQHGQTVAPSAQRACDGTSPAGLAHYADGTDVLDRRFVACASVIAGNDGPDQLVTALYQQSPGRSPSLVSYTVRPVPGHPELDDTVAPVVEVDIPGVSAVKSAAFTNQSSDTPDAERGAELAALARKEYVPVVRTTVRVPDPADPSRGRSVVSTRALRRTLTSALDYANPTTPFEFVTDGADAGRTGRPLIAVPVGFQLNRVSLRMPLKTDTAATSILYSNPVPIAFLQAPPTVGGAGQDGTSATYGSTTGSSESSGSSTSTRVGASLGLDYEDPVGLFGASVEASYEREVEQSYSTSQSVETTESYTGTGDDNTVVYRTDQLRRYRGTITRSSLGIGVGDPATLDLPLASVVSSASVTALKARFADFRPGGAWATALQQGFPNLPGDPGSYLTFDDDAGSADLGAVDTYCDGTRTGGPTAEEVRKPKNYTPANPFKATPAARPGPGIVVGEKHAQAPGSQTSEGSDITLTQEQAQSFVGTHSFDVSVGFKAAYVTGSVSAGASWGEEWSSSLSTGQSFSAEVASIPSADLTSEAYEWLMFVCHKTLTGPGGVPFPVFVQGFLTDDYVGSGGLQRMSPVELVSPIASDVVATPTTLTFRQPEGSVKLHSYRLEAVGRNQVHTGQVAAYGSVAAGTPGRPGGRGETIAFPAPSTLLPNQLYRWRVTAQDFFGQTVSSDYEFFTVDGPPASSFSPDTLTPDTGRPVVIRNDSRVTDLSSTVTCTYDFGDGTPKLVQTGTGGCPDAVQHTWTRSGTYTMTLQVCVPAGCDTEQKLITVNGTAVDDRYSVVEDSTTTFGDRPSVLANDGGRTAVLLNQAAHGTLTLRSDGAWSYRPDADFCGTDQFSYAVDGDSTRAATATLDVVCVQDAPRPLADDHLLDEDRLLAVTAPGLLVNDSDPDSTPSTPVALRASLRQQAAHGTAAVQPDGAFSYRPNGDYCGTDAFDYQVTDGLDTTAATVRLTVACLNDPPAAVADRATVDEDSDTLLPVTANDVDVDGDPLNVVEVSVPANGVADARGDGVRYQPRPNFCGDDSFSYRAADPSGAMSAAVTVSVTVVCRNDAPVAVGDEFVRKAGSRPFEVGAPGVLANDTDLDSGALQAVLHSPPHSGDLTLRPDGSFRYVPRSSNQGGDDFSYRVSDGDGLSAPVRVVITVTQGGSGK